MQSFERLLVVDILEDYFSYTLAFILQYGVNFFQEHKVDGLPPEASSRTLLSYISFLSLLLKSKTVLFCSKGFGPWNTQRAGHISSRSPFHSCAIWGRHFAIGWGSTLSRQKLDKKACSMLWPSTVVVGACWRAFTSCTKSWARIRSGIFIIHDNEATRLWKSV